MRLRRGLALAYVVLLLLSNGYRLAGSANPSPADSTHHNLHVITLALTPDAAVQVAYREFGNPAGPVVIALHGSPYAGGVDRLAAALPDYRVIAPHLPGFGRSTPRVPDYSVAAHARYVDALMQALGIDAAHIVGYSMGGGVGIALYDVAPTRVRSLSLVASIGVQELEMFGNYQLNHAVHALQLGLLLALEWSVPHFGALDRFMLNSRYARNFYDTDQRPLREILQRIAAPTLIVHGTGDTLVPLAAAREHHRIVPHSELVELAGGHGLIFSAPAILAAPLAAFFTAVDDDQAARLGDATASRVALAAEPVEQHVSLKLAGIGLLLALAALALSTLISEDAACIGAGLLVAGGIIDFWPAAIACLAGIYGGDALLFFAGRHLGAPALHRAPMKWFVKSSGIDTAKAWFLERGAVAILISRFVPGSRFPTYVAAGALGFSFVRFSGWFLLAAVLWTPALVALSAAAGTAFIDTFARFSAYALPGLIALIVVLIIVLRVMIPLTTHRGRRLLLGRWRRLTHWEFWPRWAFYPPVVAYVLYLGLRFRSSTLFTAANPAMPDGGFVGESKIDILRALGAAGDDVVATTALLPQGDLAIRHTAVDAFMREHALGYPIVLKPNVGERGADVMIAASDREVVGYLSRHDGATLVQAFAPGHEFGIFYVRRPGRPRGAIFAITDKRPPVVTGDGERTLEALILDDDRAVCMAQTFFDRHAHRLFEVPAAAQKVPLIDIGTHSRGCVFYDGEWVRSEALERAIDRISVGYDGFFFGRYDVRTPDLEAFARGEQFKIVELNGVTSEATNIYDPSNTLWAAYRVLARQWRLAFEIGAANRDAGAPVTPVATLLRGVFARD